MLFNYLIEALVTNSLQTRIQCNQTPNIREEISTQEVAIYHEHLKNIADKIPTYGPDAPILLFRGRYMIAAHGLD